MASTFVQHHINGFDTVAVPASIANTASPSDTTRTLHSLLLSLKLPLTLPQICEAAEVLVSLEQTDDPEQVVVEKIILDRLVVGIYAHALDIYLSEAIEAETEADWWANIERSDRNVLLYLVQTLPARLLGLAQTVMHAIRAEEMSLKLSLFTPASLRRLFPSTGLFRPNALVTAMFPRLQHHGHLAFFAPFWRSPVVGSANTMSAMFNDLIQFSVRWIQYGLFLFRVPLDLARHECQSKRMELEVIRDRKAESLGTLSKMRERLKRSLFNGPDFPNEGPDDRTGRLANIIWQIDRLAAERPTSSMPSRDTASLILFIRDLACISLPSHTLLSSAQLRNKHLLRPSRLTLLWPRHLVLVSFSLYAIRHLHSSHGTVAKIAIGAYQTVKGFLIGYLLEPLRDVVNTVRSGGETGIIVRKEGINADFDSLERMTLSLAKDQLKYNPAQLALLSRQIRVGDLTPILEIYEENIRSPLKSAVVGTLLRTALIQVQKAKVDLDRALAGIDKLLRSQELTFAFVGVAPAFAILYGVTELILRLWSVGKSRGKYGGRRRRAEALLAMRRLERLLISRSDHASNSTNDDILPTTAGLLLLSVTRLRAFGETCLPAHSQLREGFLQDVQDLEDPTLRRSEKLRVLDRMWKSWGGVLKWSNVMEEVK